MSRVLTGSISSRCQPPELPRRAPTLWTKGGAPCLVHVARCDAGEAIQLCAAERGRIDRLADAILELADAIGNAGDAPLALAPVAGRKIVEHLDQAAGLKLLNDHLFLRERHREKDYSTPVNPGLERPL